MTKLVFCHPSVQSVIPVSDLSSQPASTRAARRREAGPPRLAVFGEAGESWDPVLMNKDGEIYR